MRRAIAVDVSEPASDRVRGTVTLSFEDRYRRRVRLLDDDGEPFLLDLAHATRLNDGDGLVLDDGAVLVVRAADEDVLDVAGTDPRHTARLAWHIGNRHTPVEVLQNGQLRIAYDRVLAAMLEGLGAVGTRIQAPFGPEPGAYDNSTKKAEHGAGHAHADHG